LSVLHCCKGKISCVPRAQGRLLPRKTV
jgi:hypothetical protein